MVFFKRNKNKTKENIRQKIPKSKTPTQEIPKDSLINSFERIEKPRIKEITKLPPKKIKKVQDTKLPRKQKLNKTSLQTNKSIDTINRNHEFSPRPNRDLYRTIHEINDESMPTEPIKEKRRSEPITKTRLKEREKIKAKPLPSASISNKIPKQDRINSETTKISTKIPGSRGNKSDQPTKVDTKIANKLISSKIPSQDPAKRKIKPITTDMETKKPRQKTPKDIKHKVPKEKIPKDEGK